MKFSEAWWLLGSVLSLVVAGFYVLGGFRLIASIKRFGEPELVGKLLSARAGGRRALKGTLVVLSVAFAFVALAGPQYGRGTRMIPATNLDCVIVLDYSKSMYARDVSPNRTERAKAEVARLIAELPGARFGAVAFAGESMGFPLTSDGGAIAQFFRQNTPNDMPVGGTAIARALETARELLARDPLSQKHQKVIVLVTDGEDLEGDPVQVATSAGKDGIIVHVVQIGSRTPETIPEIGENGQVVGIRKDDEGRPLTTSLSANGEEQLAQIAKVGGGNVVRAETGQTGIDEIAKRLKVMMTEELAERVETVYADIFYYPLAIALLLLVLEVFIPVARKASAVAVTLLLFLSGCQKVEQRVFTRYSPDVDHAISELQADRSEDAMRLLAGFLSTGECKAGEIGTPEQIRHMPNASVDMGLALFRIAEQFGGKFGDPAPAKDNAEASAALSKRSEQVDCALRIVRIIAQDEKLAAKQRSEAFFLSGNLELLRFDYQSAVDSYDSALRLTPGAEADAGFQIGTDAAFNRGIALRLLEEQEKQKPPPGDAGSDKNKDDQKQDDQKQDDQKQDDQKQDDQKQDDQKQDDQKQDDQKQDDQKQGDQQKDAKQDPAANGSSQSPAPQQPSPGASAGGAQAAQAAKPPSLSQDDRVLDELERADLIQHGIQGRGRGRRSGGMEDK